MSFKAEIHDGQVRCEIGSDTALSGPFARLPLIPQPSEWTPAPGHLPLQTIASDNASFAAVDTLAARLGLARFCGDSGVAVTILHNPAHPAEAYALDISPSGIALTAAGAPGFLRLRSPC